MSKKGRELRAKARHGGIRNRSFERFMKEHNAAVAERMQEEEQQTDQSEAFAGGFTREMETALGIAE